MLFLITWIFLIAIALSLHPNVGLRLGYSIPSEALKALHIRGQSLDPGGETDPVILQAAEPT